MAGSTASVGDAALPPAVQAAFVPARKAAGQWAPLMAGVRHGQKCRPTVWACSGGKAVPRQEGGLPETVSPPGAMRSKPHKHRARDALGFGGLAARHDSTSLDVARRRGPWVLRTPGVPRALGSFPGAAVSKSDDGVPGAAKKQGDDAWLFDN